MAPAYGNPPAAPAPAPAPESGAADGGRRGKPKRRRFNFNVLENLEKMVQTKAEPLPPSGWTPPAAAPPTAAAPLAPVPPLMAPVDLKLVPPAAPAADAVRPVKELPAEAPSLPLPFGPGLREAPTTMEAENSGKENTEQAVAEEADELVAADEGETPRAMSDVEEPTLAAEAEASVAEVEPQTQPTTPLTPEPRKSMREMLFGEEAPAAAEAEPNPAPTESEPESATAEWSWRPTRWEPAEESAWTTEKGTAATEPEAEEPVAEDAPAVEDAPEVSPVAEASEPAPFAPWKSSFASESASESEPANGDTDGAPAVSYPETPTADAGGESNAGTVVIIEDDETAANYYATLFRGNGYRVEVANDGVSGVDLCTRVQPQVILLDVMMPRQNGILVLQTLRASDETKNTPVVVMSNFSEPTLIKRAIQLGALEYVIKTQVEGSALLTAMPRWINREKAFAAA
jgi:CheY-like chemotaxis protein